MAHNEQDHERFLDVLAERPFINYACKKSGISRAAVYRWMKDNRHFKRKVDKALQVGRENIVEIAEVALLKKVQEGNVVAIKFALSNLSKRYRSKPVDYEEIFVKENNPMASIMGPDGMITVTKRTADLVKKMMEEKEQRKKRALGLTKEWVEEHQYKYPK